MKNLLYIFGIVFLFASCNNESIPKPRGYFRIAFPEKTYSYISKDLPFSFEIADYSITEIDSGSHDGSAWVNIITPENKADLHITYIELKNDLSNHIEDSRELAYDHSIKADAIEEQLFLNNEEKVFGTLYSIEGNAASPLQFYLTDSVKHFIRGALYIREIPNIDSISPVIDFLKPDIIRIIETTKWTD